MQYNPYQWTTTFYSQPNLLYLLRKSKNRCVGVYCGDGGGGSSGGWTTFPSEQCPLPPGVGKLPH